jgi:hypothetical protein
MMMFPAHVHVSSKVSEVEISPSNPKQGDNVMVRLFALPEETIDISISFMQVIPVSENEFVLTMNSVEIPQTPNLFTVRAENVERLRVTVKIFGIPITKSSLGSDGTSVVSQGNVPKGRYWVQISGIAENDASSVKLTITARTTIVTDSKGEYATSYDTSNIPPGDFTAKIGDYTETVTLLPRDIVENQPPIVESHHVNSVEVGEIVEFSAKGSFDSDGEIIDYKWSLGDGSIYYGENITYAYSQSRTYSVILEVEDNFGAKASKESIIKVTPKNASPIAYAGFDRVTYVGFSLDFDALKSYDPDGEIREYIWQINETTLNGKIVSWTPRLPGKYLVTLTIIDDIGDHAQDSFTVITREGSNIDNIQEYIIQPGQSQTLTNKGAGIQVTLEPMTSSKIYLYTYFDDPYQGSEIDSEKIIGLYLSNMEAVQWPIFIEVNLPTNQSDAGIYYWINETWVLGSNTGYSQDKSIIYDYVNKQELMGHAIALSHRTPNGREVFEPNLLVEKSDVPETIQVWSKTDYIYSLINDGKDVAKDFYIRCEVNEKPIFMEKVPLLKPGELRTFDFSWTPSTTGVYSMEVYVDALNDIEEIDENDNYLVFQVHVKQKNQTHIFLPSILLIFMISIILLRFKVNRNR